MSGFEILSADATCQARCGIVHTAGGPIETPAFMPVGTAGAVKGITPAQVAATGAQVILANTYHLMLRPGAKTVQELGGLHRFMAWDGPILTDSGGYQLFSLSSLTKITDEGVEFASHVDGSRIYLDAERAIDIQNRLGADIIMCFDDCAEYPADHARLEKGVERTIAWARRSKSAHGKPSQLLFGIVQGGIDRDLRARCAQKLVEMEFDGYAIGGLSVGEGHEHMVETASFTARLLPAERPRYLMGVGMPAEVIAAVAAGIDMFDCVLPTRNGRNAFAFTDSGPVRLRNSTHADSAQPIEEQCDCVCCAGFSRATLRHFFNVGEMLGPILVSIHNLRFYQRLMAEIRRNISNGTFGAWARRQLDKYDAAFGRA